MDIKEQLKSIDVKISKLATGLEISRPTLDSYIDIYERGDKIPNDKYQEIFDYLFSGENSTPIEFAQKYDYVKKIMLADVKKRLADDKNAKRRAFLSGSISACANDATISVESLELVYILLRSSNNEMVHLLSEYFCLTNGITDWSGKKMNEKEKSFFSSLSIFFNRFKEGKLTVDDDELSKLLEKNEEMTGHRSPSTKNDEIADYLKKNGIDPSAIDIEQLKKMISDNKEGNQ